MKREPNLQFLLAGLFSACLMTLQPLSSTAQAQSRISIELVLAVDTSLSVDDVEYDLQMTGIARAFRRPEILSLILQQNGVAVTLFQWSSDIDPQFMIPWHELHSPTSVLAFADKVEMAKRDPVQGFTAIGRAIDFGVQLIASNGFAGQQKKIDVSGDGRNNTGVLPEVARKEALARGIVINGLPILIDTYNMDDYFREKVMYGPGAFIEIATDYVDFAEAFFRKLRRELTPLTSEYEAKPVRHALIP